MRTNTEKRLRNDIAAREIGAFDPNGVGPTFCCYCGLEGAVWWEDDGTPRFEMAVIGPNGAALRWEPAHLDHIIPECRNGPTSADNTVIACRTCNLSKGSLPLGDRGFQRWLSGRRRVVAAKMAVRDEWRAGWHRDRALDYDGIPF